MLVIISEENLLWHKLHRRQPLQNTSILKSFNLQINPARKLSKVILFQKTCLQNYPYLGVFSLKLTTQKATSTKYAIEEMLVKYSQFSFKIFMPSPEIWK